MQPQPLRREMFADHRHGEVAAALAAHLYRPCEAVVPRLVGGIAGLGEQRLPFVAGQAVVVPVRPRMFAAVIEKADIVVARFDRS